MIIVIVGESGCGKTTLAKCIEDSSNYSRVVTYTSRPPRKGEKDGEDYYFVPKSFFTEHPDKFVEIAEYNGYQYGLLKSDFQSAIAQGRNIVVIMTPSGMRRIRNAIQPGNLCCIYLRVPRVDRLMMMLNRGDDIDESYRRNLCDLGQYDGVWEEADVVVSNPEYKKRPDQIIQEAMYVAWNRWEMSLF